MKQQSADQFAGDMVNHPPHYTSVIPNIECIDVVEHLNFNIGNAIKYLWRADDKGDPLENLRKAEWYVKREIARRERLAPKAPTVAINDQHTEGCGRRYWPHANCTCRFIR